MIAFLEFVEDREAELLRLSFDRWRSQFMPWYLMFPFVYQTSIFDI
jgi:hypothetical protein